MQNYYLLFATGKDRPGIVSHVTKVLFKCGCNLEDSSMMRLGGEFGIFLIFSTLDSQFHKSGAGKLAPIGRRFGLTFTIKSIAQREARFIASRADLFLVKVLGEDKPGIVFKVCQFLYKAGFNISDLETHRTTTGEKPGYILFIEGEFKRASDARKAKAAIRSIQQALGIKIQIDPIPVNSL